ncbi:MAG: lysophospholipid acyltransferase family protein [Candidatus Ozemobacteraceae bacterium]
MTMSLPPRYSKTIRRDHYSPRVRLLGRAASFFIRTLEATLSFECEGLEHWSEARADERGPGSVLFVIWHARQIAATMVLKGRGIAAMTSQSKDGDIVSAAMENLGYRLVRGSSSRGGARSLLEMARLMKTEGCDGAITVDGPRGPIHRAKPGATLLAQRLGVPVLPIAALVSPVKQMASWDRFEVPYPFSRVVFQLGKPFFIAPTASIEEGTRLIEERIESVERAASERMAR